MKPYNKNKYYFGQLLISDPGQIRFQIAVKATASLALSTFTALLLFYLLDNISLIPIVMAGMIGMMGTIIVMDNTEIKRKVTTMLIAVSAIIGITIGTLLDDYTFIIDGLMVIIITCSFYFSRYGSRYFTLGQIAFMTVYFAYVTHLQLEQLLLVYTGIAIGAVYAYVFNFLVFRDSSHTLKRSMHSFHSQIIKTYNLLIDGIQTSEADEAQHKMIAKNVQKLRIYADVVAGQLNKAEIDKLWPGLEESQIRLYVFDTGMLVESLTESFHKLKTANALESQELRRLLVWIMSSLRDANISSEQHNLDEAELAVEALQNVTLDFRGQKDETMEWVFLIQRIESVANHIVEAGFIFQKALATGIPAKKTEEPLEKVKPEVQAEDPQSAPAKPKELSPTARKAIQVFFASIIAIIAGKTITPIQPYWMLLTVFICMLGTESVGRVYTKGLQRSTGTVVGAAIGFFLAILINGHITLELSMLFLIVFVSGYTAGVSYTLMSVFITMTVAFMYNILLSGVSFSIISARIIETIAGAAIAYIISMFIFPKKTNEKVAEAADDYLTELKPFVINSIRRLREDTSVLELTDHAMNIDKTLKAVEDEAAPIMKKTSAHSHSNISEWVTMFTAINYYARYLVASSYQINEQYSEELTELLKQLELKAEHNIDTFSSLIKGQKESDYVYKLDDERRHLEQLSLENTQTDDGLMNHLYYIWQINRCIVSLCKDFGVKEVE